jgi:hypothetical protein
MRSKRRRGAGCRQRARRTRRRCLRCSPKHTRTRRQTSIAQPSPEPRTIAQAIVGLIATQNHLLDDWELEGFVSNFVEDGVFETVLGHREGQHEIRRHFGSYELFSDT